MLKEPVLPYGMEGANQGKHETHQTCRDLRRAADRGVRRRIYRRGRAARLARTRPERPGEPRREPVSAASAGAGCGRPAAIQPAAAAIQPTAAGRVRGTA